MALTYTDRNNKTVLHSWARFKAVVLEAVQEGDLLSFYDTDATNAVQFADQGDSQNADCIACESGKAGAEITVCLKAELKAPTTPTKSGGTQTYFGASTDFFGATLFLGESGKPSSTVGTTYRQSVGRLLARDRILIDLMPIVQGNHNIGACTNGFNFTGIFSKGIIMGTTGGSGTPIALGTLTSSWYGIEICVTAALSTFECHAVRAEVRTSAASASGNINCGRFDTIIKHNIKSAEGVNCSVQFEGASTMSGRVAVVAASLYSVAGVGLTKSNNDISGIFIQHWLQDDPGALTSGYYNSGLQISLIGGTYAGFGIVLNIKTSNMTAGILIDCEDSANLPHGIRFDDTGSEGGGNVDNAIYFATVCPVANLLNFQTAVGCLATSVNAMTTNNTSHAIRVRIAGVAHYIPVWDNNTWT